MIKIETAPSKRELEELANRMAADGFRMTILAFRGIEAWAVFEKQPKFAPAEIIVSGPDPAKLPLERLLGVSSDRPKDLPPAISNPEPPKPEPPPAPKFDPKQQRNNFRRGGRR